MNETPSLETVIDRAVERALARVNTTRIGYIENYDPNTGEAEVQPADMAPFRNELGVRVPYKRAVIPHVPVYFPGGGGARDTWPIKRGDACIVLHTSNPIARWLVAGGIVDENNDRKRHRTSNAIALVGIADFGHWSPASADARVLEADDLRLGGQDADDPVARKSDLDAIVAKLNHLTGLYNTHTHIGVQTGAGTTPVTTMLETPLTAPACSQTVRSK